MKDKNKVLIFIGFLFTLSFLNLIKKDLDISISERRKLAQKPKIQFEALLDGTFIEKLEKYSLDQFIFRDGFKSLKAKVNNNIFLKLDNNDLFILNDIVYKKENKIDHKSINNFNNKIKDIKDNLSDQNKSFLIMIPQKEYYVDDILYSYLNYDEIFDNLLEINKIELRDILNKDDYFKTDTHIKQESLNKVVSEILKNLQIDEENIKYNKNFIDDFYGVYYGQALLNNKGEQITYLSNDTIENSSVKYLDDINKKSVYTLENNDSLDKYDIFLNGAQSFIEIVNKNSSNNKELIIFRDSFSSSLTPLLINYYSKITLVDTRYISSDNYLSLIDFKDSDVLFIYSTLLVNNSFILKD